MSEKPYNNISVNEARTLQDNWVETRAVAIKNSLGYEDTREFWYSLEELEAYIAQVKVKSTEQGVEKPGIRIYFAAYKEENNAQEFATVFLAPTKQVGGISQNNYDIEPLNKSKGGDPPIDY